MDDRSTRIRILNDLARRTLLGCRLVVTEGVATLNEPEAVLTKVRTFSAFDEHNDPYGEHDFGSFQQDGTTIFWKIDYYDRTLTRASADPAEPEITIRVLTVMLGSEY